MAHTSDEYRYSTRDYRTQQVLLEALRLLDKEYNYSRPRVGKEIGKLVKLMDRRWSKI